MTDYTALGLDSNLRPLNSPVVNYGNGYITGMDYDSSLERSAVTTSQIRSLTADRISAGTVIVGVQVPIVNLLNGTLSSTINIGTAAAGYVLLDGPNNRIIVNDGTTNRIVIGNV